jgi:hypothetical protein
LHYIIVNGCFACCFGCVSMAENGLLRFHAALSGPDRPRFYRGKSI